MALDGAHFLGVLRDSSVRASEGSQMEDIKWPWVGEVATGLVLCLMLFWRPG